MFEFLCLSLLSFLFGFFQKIADAHNEHGLAWFKWADIIFGVIWGGIGVYLIMYSEVLFVTYMSLNFYWLYKLKFDYTNHAISLIIMLFGAFMAKIPFPYVYIGLSLIGYIFFDLIKHNNVRIKNSFFFQYRLHFFLVPLIYSLVVGNIYGITSVIWNLSGTFFANYIFKIKR